MHGIPIKHTQFVVNGENVMLCVWRKQENIGMAQQPFVWKLCCMRRMINNRIDANTEQTMPLPHSKHWWCDLINE